MSSSSVPLTARHVRSRTQASWCGVEIRRGGISSGVVLFTGPWLKTTRSVAKSPRVAEHIALSLFSTQLLEGFWRRSCGRGIRWSRYRIMPDGRGYELVSSVRALVPQKFSVEEELMHVKHVDVKSPHVGVMWKFGRGVISSGIVLVT
ncbi:hypothetical protein TNCV_2489321 [Trichonephila clavipes]|nr:hypothetical protein TNCV_2489321 [Trichonephila clavipes]